MAKNGLLISVIVIGILAMALAIALPAEAKTDPMTRVERLGKMLFLDKSLSKNNNQSCATCHAAQFGFTGPKGRINAFGAVYPGSIPGAFGNRKPPTAAYGGESPILYYNEDDEVWTGGMFWDGRATGWVLGDPLAEQAKGPFLNPAEQALPDAQTLCWKVVYSSYAKLFKQVWGSLDCTTTQGVGLAYNEIGFSISAYEKSHEVNPFNSRFDGFWDNAEAMGMDVTEINVANYMEYYNLGLTDDEVLGLAIFNDEGKGKCSLCHTLDEGAAGYPLFTDFTYDNLGVPKNPRNPVYREHPEFIDPGLGGFLMSAGYNEETYMAEWGKFKVPTLRNVDKREGNTIKAYGHNGYFKSLYDITHFYNTRDVVDWPDPEYPVTVNMDELGNLGLSTAEENHLVLFMKTLTDVTVP
jgi:cytochrome c peroxidase